MEQLELTLHMVEENTDAHMKPPEPPPLKAIEAAVLMWMAEMITSKKIAAPSSLKVAEITAKILAMKMRKKWLLQQSQPKLKALNPTRNELPQA